MRYLLVEDNVSLSSAIRDRIALDGHVVDIANNISEAEAYIETGEYDLLLLDIMLPDGDGRNFLQNHRRDRQNTPVIVLTARSEVSDRVSVLDLGADDYLVKPFDFSELEARCRAVLRRRTGGVSNAIVVGNLIFDSLAGTVQVGERLVSLRNKELRLLEILMNAPEQIFSKAKLVDRLFYYNEAVSENAIEVYIGRLRKHIAGSDVQITTVRSVGYKLSRLSGDASLAQTDRPVP